MEQAVDVHGRDGVQVHQEIALVHGHVVQRVLEHFARSLIEVSGSADQNRAAAVLDVHVDQGAAPVTRRIRTHGAPSWRDARQDWHAAR
ncbi:hypothetical protein AB0P15_30760 [Streptomyces sp. NPDC087917]|uniref:hypothetical protein n=1 Tax=Streptomyces sp. NPDC087917 TaxID=3155060 RepID=UPI00344291FB